MSLLSKRGVSALNAHFNSPLKQDKTLTEAERNVLQKLSQPEIWVPSIQALANYPRLAGQPTTRQCMVDFMNKFFKPTVEILWQNIILEPGAKAAHDALALTLADQNDIFLTWKENCDLKTIYSCRAGVDLIELDNLTIETLTESIQNLTQSGRKVRAVILPNPLLNGEHISTDLLNSFLELMNRYSMMLIVDETNVLLHKPCSCLSMLDKLQNTDRFVWLWDFTKVFGIDAVQDCFIFTKNSQLVSALTRMEMSQNTDVVQNVVRMLLSDHDWIEKHFCAAADF